RRPTGDRPDRDRPQGDRPAWQDRRPSGERGRPSGDRRPDRAGSRSGPAHQQQDRRPPLPPGPELPEWVDPRDLDPVVRSACCERALGRAEVALRLVAEALAEQPDSEELTELRLVEAGARRDLGELAAARLVLEAALGGGRPDPSSLDGADENQLRIASAYADL